MSEFAVQQTSKSTTVRIFLSIFVVLVYFLNPIPYSKAKGHILSTRTWLRTGSFVFPEPPEWRAMHSSHPDLDPMTVFGEHGVRDGHIYPKYPPGTCILLAPLDVLAQLALPITGPRLAILPDEKSEVVMVNCLGALVWSAGSVATLGVLIWWAAGRITPDPRIRLATVALAIFGTILFYHGTGLFTKPISCAFTFAGFLSLWRLKTNSAHGYLLAALAGFLLGFAVLIDYQVGITLVFVAVYAALVLPYRQTAVFCIGAGVPVAALLMFHWVVMGHPLATTYSAAAGHRLAAGLRLPQLDAVLGLTIGLERGVLWYMPAVVIGLGGLVLAWRRRDLRAEVILCSLLIGGYFAFSMCAFDWTSGPGYGPRYLVPAIPFAMLWAPFALARWPRWITVGLATMSMFVSYLGAQVYFIPSSSHSQLWTALETFLTSGGAATRLWRWLLEPSWTAASGFVDPGHALVLVSHALTLLLISAWLYFVWRSWPGWRDRRVNRDSTSSIAVQS